MAQLNVISERKAEKVKRTKLPLEVQPSDNGCVNSQAPFFCDYVINYLMRDPSLGKTREERSRTLRTGGLTIRTTIDLRFQQAADTAMQAATDPTDQAIGGMAMVEPGTGNVKALVPVTTDGPGQGAGTDLPQLRGAPGVRRLQRLPARIDVQGVRAGAGAQAGCAAQLLAHGAGPGIHPAR